MFCLTYDRAFTREEDTMSDSGTQTQERGDTVRSPGDPPRQPEKGQKDGGGQREKEKPPATPPDSKPKPIG